MKLLEITAQHRNTFYNLANDIVVGTLVISILITIAMDLIDSDSLIRWLFKFIHSLFSDK